MLEWLESSASTFDHNNGDNQSAPMLLVQHRNLVRARGHCAVVDVPLIVRLVVEE